MRNRRPDNLHAAIESFDKAKAKDANFVLAYVGLADAYALLNIYEVPPPTDAFAVAKKNALKALEINENLAEANASLAYILFYGDRNRTEAEKYFRRAIELNPSYSTAHHWYALALAAMGKTDESIRQINTAMQLEPRSAIIKAAAGLVYFYARRYDESLEISRQSLEINPKFVPGFDQISMTNVALGNYETAFEAYSKQRFYVGDTDENDPGWLMVTAQIQSLNKDKIEQAKANLQKSVSSSEIKNNVRAYAFEIAVAYSLLNEKDEAIKWIETAKNSRNHSFNFVKVDPRLDNIREEPKFQEIINDAFK